MKLSTKRWITAGATLAMVATMGLSACSTNRGHLTSETGKNEVTMASRTPNWIFPISAKGYTQGENGQFIQAMYRPPLRLQVHLRNPLQDQPGQVSGHCSRGLRGR